MLGSVGVARCARRILFIAIYPCLRGWLVAGLPLICTKGRAPGYKSMGRSHIHDSIIAIQSIKTSCSCALPVYLDSWQRLAFVWSTSMRNFNKESLYGTEQDKRFCIPIEHLSYSLQIRFHIPIPLFTS
jgi:hypothetical protein